MTRYFFPFAPVCTARSTRRTVPNGMPKNFSRNSSWFPVMNVTWVCLRFLRSSFWISVLCSSFQNHLSAKLPPINEIAHDVEVGGFGVAEKFEQFADLGVFRAQVDVGYPDRAIVHRRLSQVAG